MNNNDLKFLLRRKYSQFGLEGMSEKEITQLLLSYASPKDFTELADTLLKNYSKLTTLMDADSHALLNSFGLDSKTVVLLKLIPHLSKIYLMKQGNTSHLSSSKAAIKYFESFFIGAVCEQLAVVCTDEKFKIIACRMISKGTAFSVELPFRQLAEFALNNNSSRIFIVHNHLAESALPSAKDISATLSLSRSLDLLGVSLIDHIITCSGSAVSMREQCNAEAFDNSPCFGYRFSGSEHSF